MTLLEQIKKIPGSKKDLKKFGITLGVFFALLGLLFWWRGRVIQRDIFLILSPLFLIPAFLFPQILKPVQKMWMGLAYVMGWVMLHVILSVMFYLVLTPIGLLERLFGKDLLKLKTVKRETYWSDCAPRDKTSCENQF